MRLFKKNPLFVVSAIAAIILAAGLIYNLEKRRIVGKSAVDQRDSQSAENDGEAKDDESLSLTVSDRGDAGKPATASSSFLLHKNITVTYFWAGEEAGEDNKNISNLPSAWDDQWAKDYGGVDDPQKRNGYFPAKFMPKENPFYFALPYNDFDDDGKRKAEVFQLAAWAKSRTWKDDESVLKNQWIKIIKGGKTAYAQWEDVGPFKENDAAYVFGNAQPASKTNERAGLDVSPAVKDFLGLSDIDRVDWQFMDAGQVPDGPWKKVITDSQINWN